MTRRLLRAGLVPLATSSRIDPVCPRAGPVAESLILRHDTLA